MKKGVDTSGGFSYAEIEMGNCAVKLRPLKGEELFWLNSIRPVRVPSLRAFDISGDVSDFAQQCRSPEGLANAFGMLEAISEKGKERSSGNARAVYVIGVEGEPEIAKIGISANAISRLSELQGGHYRTLVLYGVVFTPMRNAGRIEQGVLAAASERGDRMNGEWVAKSADALLKEALEFARDNNIPIVDGQTWFSDMAERTKCLARSTRFRKAA